MQIGHSHLYANNYTKMVCHNPTTRQIRSAYSRLWSLRFPVATLPSGYYNVQTIKMFKLNNI